MDDFITRVDAAVAGLLLVVFKFLNCSEIESALKRGAIDVAQRLRNQHFEELQRTRPGNLPPRILEQKFKQVRHFENRCNDPHRVRRRLPTSTSRSQTASRRSRLLSPFLARLVAGFASSSLSLFLQPSIAPPPATASPRGAATTSPSPSSDLPLSLASEPTPPSAPPPPAEPVKRGFSRHDGETLFLAPNPADRAPIELKSLRHCTVYAPGVVGLPRVLQD